MQPTLSHYRILEEIGSGGMGVVYRAHDERLDRDVALKVLPTGALADEAARKRFRKEALALSKLNHPNIATIFDFDTQDGTDFLVEELIPGLALSEMLTPGPLPEQEIISLGAQLCEGLAAAHEQGIIHRDLKPANIRVTPDARLKILDFGLAKVLRAGVAGDMDATLSAETQQVSGTLPYMAPEQLLNEKLDARTDIWAAGCVLYEMATGRRAFSGSGPALIDAILHQPSAPPSALNHKVAPGLEAVILKCLERDPGLRYASAREIAVDLHRLGTGTVTKALAARRRAVALKLTAAAVVIAAIIGVAAWLAHQRSAPTAGVIRSIAVLPFTNLSGDPQQEYFADGMTDALIGELSKIRSLKVISRTSVMQYKGVKKPLPEVARELGVEAVIEGAIVREGQRVRVTVQFIEAATDRNLWAERYDRDLTSILALQSEVASDIAARTKAEITPRERAQVAFTRTVKPEAYEAYLKGRHHLDTLSDADLRKSADYFRLATQIDPSYALAYAALSEALFQWRGLRAVHYPEAVAAEEKAAALKSVELDSSLAEAHLAVARSAQGDWGTQEREYKRALELKPGYAPALAEYAADYLTGVGRLDEAIILLKRVLELEPLSPTVRIRLGRRYFYARRYDEAIEQFKIVLELNPNDSYTRASLGRTYLFKGMIQRGLAELEKAGDDGLLAHGYAMAGRRREALKILSEHKQDWARMTPATLAIVYGALGEKDEAFRWLEEAYRVKEQYIFVLKVQPIFDPLRSDPRFQDLLRRMNFPD